MAAKAIPPKLEPEILAKAGEGLTTQKISDWLLKTHKVTASRMAVQRLLERIRKERAPIAQAIVQSELASTITADLAGIDDLIKSKTKLLKRAGDLSAQLKLLEKIQKADLTRLFDPVTHMPVVLDKLPKSLKVAIHSITLEADGGVKYRLHDKLRATAEHVGIQTGTIEELRRLLETRLKLAGAGGDDPAEVTAKRERLLKKLEAQEAED